MFKNFKLRLLLIYLISKNVDFHTSNGINNYSLVYKIMYLIHTIYRDK